MYGEKEGNILNRRGSNKRFTANECRKYDAFQKRGKFCR